MERRKARAPLSHRVWWRVVLAAALVVPAITARPYEPARTADVVREVLQAPYVTAIPALLPVAKLLLLAVAVLPFLGARWAGRALIGYYATILVAVGFGQNMADTTTYGFAWLIGNTMVMLVVAVWCVLDLVRGRTTLRREGLRRGRLWLLVPMALTLLMPYAMVDGSLVPSIGTVLTNEAGVTYCMITPVVLGTLLLFPDEVDRRTLGTIAWVGLLFGLLNLLDWFVLHPAYWWMGVLHLPLVLTAGWGLIESRPGTSRPTVSARG